MLPYVALSLGILYALVDYVNGHYSFLTNVERSWKLKMVSFAAGGSVAYLFLHMAPTVLSSGAAFGAQVLVFPLIGFSIFHMVEMLIFKQDHGSVLRIHLSEAHIIALFIYHFGAGMVLYDVAAVNLIKGMLFFCVLLLFTVLVAMPKHSIHGHERIRGIRGVFMSSGGFLGVLIAYIADVIPSVNITPEMFITLYGLVVGFMFFIVIRETVPEEKKGEPHYFALGVIILSALSFLV